MAKGPAATYTIEHTSGWKIEGIQINNVTFDRAEKGYVHSQTKICLMIRKRIEKEPGDYPGLIYYGDLAFTKVRDVPATSAKMKPPALLRK